MQELTPRQGQVFEFIKQSNRDTGRPPTIRDIANRFKFRSPRSVQTHLDVLERKGYIERHRNVSRGIDILVDDSDVIRVIGRVAAGNLLEAIEHPESELPIRASAFGSAPHFALRVEGDSMRCAGILDGDYCIVRSQTTASFGQIIVAMVDGETTIKRLVSMGEGNVGLKPENPDYSVRVVAGEQLRIMGVVKGVWRAIG